jgi:UDPglucose--hexose-1-phosphate uridylyltransferase
MFEGKWEKRWNPLRQEWVIYAAHRNNRPWSFEGIQPKEDKPNYDPECYLCPNNSRVHGDKNPDYKGVFIFDNDHPVVGEEAPQINETTHGGLYRKRTAFGQAKVVCYDNRHNVTLSDVPPKRVFEVFKAFQNEMKEFEKHPKIKNVFIFENKGEVVGVSNPHPHCQIYATDFVFTQIQIQLNEIERQKKLFGINLFEEIIKAEQKDQIRVISENDGAIAFIPFFARYAYEVMVFPKNRHQSLITMNDKELKDLSACVQDVIKRFDLNFKMSFPYMMCLFQAPVDGVKYPEYHFHILFLPPLRQPGLVKFLGGPESGGGNFMADTMPEDKAAELRNIKL